MSVNADDIRAAVAAGMISEAQAASLTALSDARRGARENLTGLQEPFELFRGFNEVFIIIGLTILYTGWFSVTGMMGAADAFDGGFLIWGVISLVALSALAAYFTLRRRMVGPSIALAIMFAISATQTGMALSFEVGQGVSPLTVVSAGTATALLTVFWLVFRIPFALSLIALGGFATIASIFVAGGADLPELDDLFLLSGEGPFALLTIALGLVALTAALAFDMSDPHRVTRNAANAFWLHVIAAPAIVNTVALTLFQSEAGWAQPALIGFLTLIALFAVIIDRRSFLISGVGYVVALALTLFEDQTGTAILTLGLVLVLVGAQWERLRGALMSVLPNFPGKDRLPPWGLIEQKDTPA